MCSNIYKFGCIKKLSMNSSRQKAVQNVDNTRTSIVKIESKLYTNIAIECQVTYFG